MNQMLTLSTDSEFLRPRHAFFFAGNLASQSPSTGSPAGRTPLTGDGSMYSQAHVRAARMTMRVSSNVAVRDRGHWRGVCEKRAGPYRDGWNGGRPWVRLERTGELVRNPKITSANDTEGHARKCVERYCELANSCTKSQVLAWMIIISRKRNLNQLEKSHKFAHKLS